MNILIISTLDSVQLCSPLWLSHTLSRSHFNSLFNIVCHFHSAQYVPLSVITSSSRSTSFSLLRCHPLLLAFARYCSVRTWNFINIFATNNIWLVHCITFLIVYLNIQSISVVYYHNFEKCMMIVSISGCVLCDRWNAKQYHSSRLQWISFMHFAIVQCTHSNQTFYWIDDIFFK